MIFTISVSYNVYIVKKESHGYCDTNDINRYETTTCSWHVVRFKVYNYRIEHKLTLNTVNISHFAALVGRYGLDIKCGDQEVIFTARQRSCGKVMFSLVSICHSVHRGERHPHVTVTSPNPLLDIGPHCTGTPPAPPLLVTSGGQD